MRVNTWWTKHTKQNISKRLGYYDNKFCFRLTVFVLLIVFFSKNILGVFTSCHAMKQWIKITSKLSSST